MSPNVRDGNWANGFNPGSANTRFSAAASPASTRPPNRSDIGRSTRSAVCAASASDAVNWFPAPPGVALLRPPARGRAALQIGPIGGRGQHHAVLRRPDRVRAAADQDQTEQTDSIQVIDQGFDRLAVPDRHRAERHLDPRHRAVAGDEFQPIRVRRQVVDAIVPTGEPVDPADDPGGRDLHLDATTGRRTGLSDGAHNALPASHKRAAWPARVVAELTARSSVSDAT